MKNLNGLRWLGASVIVLALMPMGAIGAANAQENGQIATSLIDDEVVGDIREFLQNDVVQISVNAANRRREGISEAEILELDKKWREEKVSSGEQPLIATALGSPVSSYLLRVQAASGGLYNEIFVMDANGLNVGQSSITSDYWQGDEAKVQKTFDVGIGELFIDEPEFNSQRGIWSAQVNLTLDHDGNAIGAATVEINLTELKRRKELGLI